MRHLHTRDRAAELLGPYTTDLASCIRDAIEQFVREREGLPPISSKTRACTINDYAIANAERMFDGNPDVRLIRTDHDRLVMSFFDEINVCFKKLNRRHRISAIPTQKALAWAGQEPLDGFAPGTNLVAGYVLDELGELEQVLLVCSRFGRKMWVLDLDAGAEATGTVLPFTAPDATEPGRAIVRSESEKDAKDEEAGGDA